MTFRSRSIVLVLAATFTAVVCTAAHAADQPDAPPPAEASPGETPFPTEGLSPALADLLKKAAEGDPAVSAAPVKPPTESEDQPAEPTAPAAQEPPPQPAGPPMPDMPAPPPGMTSQVLRGVLHKPGEQPGVQSAAPQPETPSWILDALPNPDEIEWRSPEAAPLQPPLGEGLPSVQPRPSPAAGQVRQPTKTAPAVPPDGLPQPNHPSLIEAVEAGDTADVENHILRGADLEAANAQGDTPVMAAAREGRAQILELLLDYGASPLSANDQMQTVAIVEAARKKHWECVRLLREFGAVYSLSTAAFHGDTQSMKDILETNPGALEESGAANRNTPMHFAAIGGHTESVRFLAEKGAGLSPSNSTKDTPFAYAVNLNHAEVVKTLVELGVDVNERLKGGETVLHRKARDGNTETVDLVLSLGGDINAPDETGATPLHVAAACNHPQMIDFLVDRGARVDATDNQGETPLHIAAGAGAVAALTALLDRGAGMAALDSDGATPLHSAAKGGKKETLLALWEHGADPAAVTNRQATLLHSVVEGAGARPFGQDRRSGFTNAMEHRFDLVDLLMDRGLAVDARDDEGMTPLHYAAKNGQRVMCYVLLRDGAPVNATDALGRTPLLCALEKAFNYTANTLLEAGADVKKADNLGRTPLQVAAQTADKQLVQHILDQGADVRAVDSNGWTVLHYAADKGTADVVVLLLAMGAPLNARDIAGRLPLHIAAHRDTPDVVNVLAGNGSELSAKDFKGRQPLHVAAAEGCKESVEILLDYGADPNETDSAGYTPLHIAAELGNYDLIRPLIYYNADINLRNNDGKTPRDLAQANGDRRMLSLFRTSVTGEFDRAMKEGDAKGVERLIATNRALVNWRQGGRTALHVAAENGNRQLVELLLGYGANVALSESVGNQSTPLHLAAAKGHQAIVELLLMMGANPAALDAEKRTPADVAEQSGHAEVAAAIRKYAEKTSVEETSAAPGGGRPRRRTLFSLIAAGNVEEIREMLDAYREAVSKKFLSLAPVQLAATMGKKEILALLLERGADPNSLSNANTGRTLLHEAANRGLSEICEILVSAGADPNALDKDGKKPAELASANGFSDLAKLLKGKAVQETE